MCNIHDITYICIFETPCVHGGPGVAKNKSNNGKWGPTTPQPRNPKQLKKGCGEVLPNLVLPENNSIGKWATWI